MKTIVLLAVALLSLNSFAAGKFKSDDLEQGLRRVADWFPKGEWGYFGQTKDGKACAVSVDRGDGPTLDFDSAIEDEDCDESRVNAISCFNGPGMYLNYNYDEVHFPVPHLRAVVLTDFVWNEALMEKHVLELSIRSRNDKISSIALTKKISDAKDRGPVEIESLICQITRVKRLQD